MFKRTLASTYLRASGWRIEGQRPTAAKYVLIAAPHTSNWDGINLVALAESIGLPLSWMVKDSHVRGAKGWLLRRVGAIGIDRSKANNVVAQMVEEFRSRDQLVLAIPPEGTRSRPDYWKSGFYHIALGARVPVVPGYLDFARKRGGFGPELAMTGDVRRDMDRIRAFYAELAPTAKFPGDAGPIRLREEAEDARA